MKHLIVVLAALALILFVALGISEPHDDHQVDGGIGVVCVDEVCASLDAALVSAEPLRSDGWHLVALTADYTETADERIALHGRLCKTAYSGERFDNAETLKSVGVHPLRDC